ncbi:MAG: hypothetical protein AAGH83_05465 [Pseudomonadota bacterium]
MAVTTRVDIKNVHTQMARINTDEGQKVSIGGGKSNVAATIGTEFAKIVGGNGINYVEKGRHDDELIDILKGLLTSSGNNAPLLASEGVSLVSLSCDSFTLALDGAAGSTNFIEFSGTSAEQAIESVLFTLDSGGPAANFKNSASQVALFDMDSHGSVFIGEAAVVGAEADQIIGGSSMSKAEATELFEAVVSGKQENGTAGVEGVELLDLTDEGFTLEFEGQAATKDTIIFKGQGAIDAIAAADAAKGVDFKDGVTALDIFDVASESSEFVGDTNPNTIGADFDALIGGSKIHNHQVLDIFEALISGNGRNGVSGLEKVDLIGLNNTSFSIAVNSAGGNTDYILFTNVDALDGAEAFGFYDDSLG